jgi:hypothetical protein
MSNDAKAQAQNRLSDDADFWNLPVECDRENYCQKRISSNGTIYSWNENDFKLYISRKNVASYETYNLGQYKQGIALATDFAPFDELGYIVFYSPIGASRTLSRYDIDTGTLELMQFPDGFDLIGCNWTLGVRQLKLRHIYPIGTNNNLMACTTSPQSGPVIHIIDVTSLTIRKTLDIQGYYGDGFEPYWMVAGGINDKIYAIVYNPETTVVDVPQIDETIEEFVFVYDIPTETWTYEIKPKENTFEILDVLPDGTLLFQNNTVDGKEIIQFTSDFKILRRFLNIGGFIDTTSDGNIFFLSDDSDILIENINDYPTLLPVPKR